MEFEEQGQGGSVQVDLACVAEEKLTRAAAQVRTLI